MNDKRLNKQYLRAKKRVDELKGFYTHLAVFIIVNTFISFFRIKEDVDAGDELSVAFSDGSNFSLWLWWGIGLVFHFYGVFGTRLFMSKEWEDRKIKEYMNEK